MSSLPRGAAVFVASCTLLVVALVIASSGSDGDDGGGDAASAEVVAEGEELSSSTAVPAPTDADEVVEVAGQQELSEQGQSGGAAAARAPSTESPTAEDAPEAVGDDVRPVRVRIPEIDVDADVIDLGLNVDGTLEVPTDFAQTGWYTGRSVPGAVGPSVVVGHVDSFSGPAVFYQLSDLEAGDTIEIHRSDGVVARFRVTRTKMVDKDEFPTVEVYGPTEAPTLRLITCGGDFDQSARSYEGNFLVFAEHVENVTV